MTPSATLRVQATRRPSPARKGSSATLRQLRAQLRYYQAAARLDLAAARGSIQRCRVIGKQMRELAGKGREKGS